jgi:hypothetical protein
MQLLKRDLKLVTQTGSHEICISIQLLDLIFRKSFPLSTIHIKIIFVAGVSKFEKIC